MRASGGKLIVRAEKTIENTVTAPGGMEFFIDISGDEQDNVRIFADVVAVPDDPGGGILPEVKVGDRVYFNYMTLMSGDENNSFTHEGEILFHVPYSRVFCAVRGGEIIMVGGHVLLEEVSSHVIGPEGLLMEDMSGRKIDRIDMGFGILAHIGSPVGGETMNPVPKAGDKVFFNRSFTFYNVIEGKKYIVIQQEDILGIMTS